MTCSRGSTTSLLVSLALVPAIGCGGVGEEGTHADRVFSGYVIDSNGAPIADALVKSDDGLFSDMTDGLGQFIIPMEIDDGRPSITLVVSREGYLGNSATIPLVDATSHYTTLVTLAQGEVQTLNATEGGELSFADGKLRFSFGAGGWADEFGNPIEGEIQVAAKLIEPEELRPDRMPVGSMLAQDPGFPGVDVLIASYGMFVMEGFQDGEQIYPASGTSFGAEITGIERFVEEGDLQADSDIPLWTMAKDKSYWEYAGWWSVVASETGEEATGDSSEGAARVSSAEDDPIVGSDNTRYSIVTDVPVGTGSGQAPPQTPRYNCDARPILSCVQGKILAEGLHGNTTSTKNPEDSLSESGVGGAWVGFVGRGQAEFCSQCECVEQKTRQVCYEAPQEDGSTVTQCYTEVYEETTYSRPQNGGATENACDAVDPNKSCQCVKYEQQSVTYQGAAYTNADGSYCANVGSGGLVTSATVLKDWMITETDPKTGQKSSYIVSYEYNENPRLRGPAKTMCEDGVEKCANWNHTIPCEWFWMNGGCAIVGGCEVFHLRGYDDENED